MIEINNLISKVKVYSLNTFYFLFHFYQLIKEFVFPLQIFLNSSKQKTLETLRQVAKTSGCFVVKNSPFSLNNNRPLVLRQLKDFYNLSISEKIQVGTLQGQGATRGYFQIGSESGSKKLVEEKESFSFGYNVDQIPQSEKENLTLIEKNLWHNSFNQSAFYSVLQSFDETARQLVSLCSEAFDIDLSNCIDKTSSYQSFIRSFKYHGFEGNNISKTGNSLHTDWNLLTLVWTDSPGFQFLKSDNTYEDVFDVNDKGALICNFGDFLASVTNGKVQSPWHLVKPPQLGLYRHSLVYFFYPATNYPAIKEVIYQKNRPLGIFVDQSKIDQPIWKMDEQIQTMGQVYAEKWKQVSRIY